LFRKAVWCLLSFWTGLTHLSILFYLAISLLRKAVWCLLSFWTGLTHLSLFIFS
jgi:hypothetical protein